MTVLGEHMEAYAILNTTSTSTTLLGVCARDKRLDESRQLATFVKPHGLLLACIDNSGDIRNGDT